MRLLVCGDRNWSSMLIIRLWLRYLKPSVVITGGAKGADTLVAMVASELGVPAYIFPADWTTYGKAAGPIRNQQMLDEGKPDLVLAFHFDIEESKGTADMLTKAEGAGVDYALVG